MELLSLSSDRDTIIHLLPPSMLRYQDEPSHKHGLFVCNFVSDVCCACPTRHESFTLTTDPSARLPPTTCEGLA